MQKVINDILLDYQILGDRQKRAIVILHGWGRTYDEWLPTAKSLSSDYQVILINLPGFGGSTLLSKKDAGVYDYAQVIGTFLKTTGIKEIILLGHSFGGKISIVLTSTSSYVKKLFLVSPSGSETKPITVRVKIFIVKLLKPIRTMFPFTGKVIDFVFASRDYKNSGELATTFKKIISQKVVSEAKNIKVPTIIIWGDLDKELPVSNALILKNLVKNSVLRIAWGSGHFPHVEKSEQFLLLLREYL